MQKPILQSFNDAIVYIATRLFPLGFDVFNAAPNSYEELRASMERTNRLAIWTGDYTDSAFADSEVWRQFRAWHDWTHYRYGCGFNMLGEHEACHVQAGQLRRLYGSGEDVAQMVALLFQSILGPLEQQAAGIKVESNYQLSLDQWESWLPYARRVLAEQGDSDNAALAYARRCYDLRAEVGPPIPAPRLGAIGGAFPSALDARGEADPPSLFA